MACDWLLKYAAGLAGGLAAAGAAPALMTREHGLEFGGDQMEMHTGIARLAGPDVPLWTLPGRLRDVRALPGAWHLAKERRAFAPDVIHLQNGIENDARLVWAAGVRPRRYAYTIHDPVGHPGNARPAAHVRILTHRLLHEAALVFVHADPLRDELLAHRRVTAPVVVVPHGVPAPDVRPLPGDPSILFFGRLTAYKGLDVLLDAMADVWSAIPAARLVIAGEGTVGHHPALHDVRTTLRREHVPERDLPGLYGDSTVVALPYVQASQSGVGSLAKSHGRPLVVTRTGGLPDLVADGSGVVVEPGDASALGEALVEILRDPGRAQAMSDAATRTARSAANWARVGELTLAAYREHGLLDAVPRASVGR
jgi:glycosyltransferase involved in cell wall biosynthesis